MPDQPATAAPLCNERPFATWREAMQQPGATDYYGCTQHGAYHVVTQAVPSRRQHRHLPKPVDVIAQAIRIADWKHDTIGTDELAEIAVKALRDAGYRLMMPCCEACDDDGISW